MKILICDDFPQIGTDAIRAIPGVSVVVKTKLTEDQLIKEASDYEALVVRSSTKITQRVIDAAKKLRVVARAGMGYDNIDLKAATAKGVAVMNTPGSNSVATAEHAIAMMMALSRNIPQAFISLKAGKWDRKTFVGAELTRKTLGIVGLGNVGREVAQRAKGFRMKVLAFDPFTTHEKAQVVGAELVSLDDLYSQADFITLHATLNEKTQGMINSQSISMMKPGVRIVNCARGELVDEKALEEGLKSGKIAGAALDVFVQEPPAQDHPLLKFPNVIATPHLGASTDEAQEQVALAVADQLRAFVLEEVVINGVNVPAVSAEVLKALGSYLDLSQVLGGILGQLNLSGISEIHVECAGDIQKYDTTPITTSVLRGLLEHITPGHVNFVNAPHIAKDRGIKVVEAKTAEARNFVNLIRVTVKTDHGDQVAAGSVFGKDNARIVQLNRFYLEVVPKGHLLIIQNEDRPGVVGAWGTILGKNQINISRMQVALDEEKKEALSVVNIDTPAPQKVIDELRKVTNIRSVTQVKLTDA